MIVTHDFVWGHMPKTGGTSFWKFIDNHGRDFLEFRSRKHIFFKDMMEEYNSKKYYLLDGKKKKVISLDMPKYRVLGFRRLPSMLISNAFFLKERHGTDIGRKYISNGLQYAKNMSNIKFSDDELEMWEPDLVSKFIRCEFMYEDYNSLFDNFNYRINISNSHYNKVEHPKATEYFSRTEIDRIYNNNPLWAKIEESLYGSLL